MGFETRNKVSPQGGLGGMTDVVFLLLFFFVILSTKVVNGEEVNLPTGSINPVEMPPATITIKADNTIQLNNKVVAQDELPAKLNAMFFNKAEKDKKVIINGDRDADWGVGMEIMTAVNDIGFKVSVAMKPGRK